MADLLCPRDLAHGCQNAHRYFRRQKIQATADLTFLLTFLLYYTKTGRDSVRSRANQSN